MTNENTWHELPRNVKRGDYLYEDGLRYYVTAVGLGDELDEYTFTVTDDDDRTTTLYYSDAEWVTLAGDPDPMSWERLTWLAAGPNPRHSDNPELRTWW